MRIPLKIKVVLTVYKTKLDICGVYNFKFNQLQMIRGPTYSPWRLWSVPSIVVNIMINELSRSLIWTWTNVHIMVNYCYPACEMEIKSYDPFKMCNNLFGQILKFQRLPSFWMFECLLSRFSPQYTSECLDVYLTKWQVVNTFVFGYFRPDICTPS